MWKSKSLTTIVFYEASKGNPGNAGAGGVIYSPDNNSRDSFYWGLGQKSNNQAEIYGLLKACLIAREKGVKDFQAFGDSEILIKKLNAEVLFDNASLNSTGSEGTTVLLLREKGRDMENSLLFAASPSRFLILLVTLACLILVAVWAQFGGGSGQWGATSILHLYLYPPLQPMQKCLAEGVRLAEGRLALQPHDPAFIAAAAIAIEEFRPPPSRPASSWTRAVLMLNQPLHLHSGLPSSLLAARRTDPASMLMYQSYFSWNIRTKMEVRVVWRGSQREAWAWKKRYLRRHLGKLLKALRLRKHRPPRKKLRRIGTLCRRNMAGAAEWLRKSLPNSPLLDHIFLTQRCSGFVLVLSGTSSIHGYAFCFLWLRSNSMFATANSVRPDREVFESRLRPLRGMYMFCSYAPAWAVLVSYRAPVWDYSVWSRSCSCFNGSIWVFQYRSNAPARAGSVM